MNKGIFPAQRASGGAPERPWCSELQARELFAPDVVMTPERLQYALTNWGQLIPQAVSSASGAFTVVYPFHNFCDSSATANGATNCYTTTAGGPGGTLLMDGQSTGIDWTKRRVYALRIRRESTAASAGYGRFYFGHWVTAAAGSQPVNRAIGFELRGTSPRLWVIAHDGTNLVQLDSGWDVSGGSGSVNEYVVESLNGVVNVYVDGILRGSTPGGPTTSGGIGGISYQVGNGGNSARTAYIVSACRGTI